MLYSDQQNYLKAEQEFKQANILAPEFVPSYISLANLYNQLGRNSEAEIFFHKAIKLTPDDGELYYSLGLLLAESQQYTPALNALDKATALLPERTRVAYNYALVLQQVGKVDQAESVLKGLADRASEPDAVYALIGLYAQKKQWALALPYATKLVEITNSADGTQRIVDEIEAEINNQLRD